MDELIEYNSHDTWFKSPFGAVPCQTHITLSIKVHSEIMPNEVLVRLWVKNQEEKYKMILERDQGDTKIYQVQIQAPKEPMLIWYYFMVRIEDQCYYYGNNDQDFGGVGIISKTSPKSYQITVYKENTSTPQWFSASVMYQIFVDRFHNGNEDGKIENPKPQALIHPNWDDTPIYIKDEQGKILRWDYFGGNLLGIIKKLPYLKNLGINILYLNPIFEAESNHKYDTGNYKKIDPMFGDKDTFKTLCTKSKELGIEIILDGVFSHTGSNSIYFNKEGQYDTLGAYESPDSEYFHWYRFINYPDEYECWWGVENLPNVNETVESYLDYIIGDEDSVLKYWMKLGAKGWRLDVVDELPESFLKLFYKTLKEIDKESILIGEVWEDASNKRSYDEFREYLLGEDLDSVMNYPLRKIILDFVLGNEDATYTTRALMSLRENYPIQHFYATMNHISNHDLPRIITVIKEHFQTEDEHLVFKVLKLITLFQMTVPGVPCIYYGDEVGVEGGKDPENRKTYPWGREDKALFTWYQQIIQLRNDLDVLKVGNFKPLYAMDHILSYRRCIEGSRDVFGNAKSNDDVMVIINRSSNEEETFEMSVDTNKIYIDIFNEIFYGVEDNKLTITLEPLGYRVLREVN